MRILIVDDVPTNLRLLRAILETESLEVVEAEDGLVALDFLAKESFDLIISDIQMPRVDGYQLCYKVRNDPKNSTIPFIIYSSTYTSAGDRKFGS